jgi:hypothetical protein
MPGVKLKKSADINGLINEKRPGGHQFLRVFSFQSIYSYRSSAMLTPWCFRAAWAAARRATGTRNGEQLT